MVFDEEESDARPVGDIVLDNGVNEVELHREAVAQELVLAGHVEVHLAGGVLEGADLESAVCVCETELDGEALVDFDGGFHWVLGIVRIQGALTRVGDHDIGRDRDGRLLFTVRAVTVLRKIQLPPVMWSIRSIAVRELLC